MEKERKIIDNDRPDADYEKNKKTQNDLDKAAKEINKKQEKRD